MQDPDCFGYRKFYIRKFLQHENVLRVDMDIAVDDAELSTDARPQQKHKQAPEDISKLSKEELLELLVTERALQVKRRASREPLCVVTLSSPYASSLYRWLSSLVFLRAVNDSKGPTGGARSA